MSILMNIATPTNQSSSQVLNIAVGTGAQNPSQGQTKTTSNDFAALIATLLGLNKPEQAAEKPLGTTEENAKQSLENITATLGANSAIDLAQITNISGLPNEQQNGLTALSDLLKSLEMIGKALENGQEVDPKLIDKSIAAINVLAAQLNSIVPTPIGSSIVAATGIYQSLNTNSQTELASLALQGINSANSQSTSNLAQTQNPINLAAKDIVSTLQQFAQNLSDASPKLSQEINTLINKFTNGANNPNNISNQSANSSTNQTMSLQAALAQTGLTKLATSNSKPDSNSANNRSSVDLAPQSLAPKTGANNNLTTVISPKSLNVNADSNQQLSNSVTSQAGNSNILIAQNASKASISSQVAKLDGLAQSEPILAVQSNGQPALITGSPASIKPATALFQQPTQNLNLPHIAYEFASNVKAGNSRFQIQLNPPEMGRIDVRMEIDKSGALNARLTVERVETLDLLQRDARALERALSQAGLDSSKTNLEFSLKDNPFAKNDNGFDDGHESFDEAQAENEIETDIDIINQMPNTIIHRGTATLGGLNMTA
ncbi:MAG: flagellar hook-length control protein FliK [Devosiaceae bacterium]|nr:flagellar hook-length control protein FliK [Devosiaceae bacterium]